MLVAAPLDEAEDVVHDGGHDPPVFFRVAVARRERRSVLEPPDVYPWVYPTLPDANEISDK